MKYHSICIYIKIFLVWAFLPQAMQAGRPFPPILPTNNPTPLQRPQNAPVRDTLIYIPLSTDDAETEEPESSESDEIDSSDEE